MTETAQPVFDCWCIVDLYGHQQIAGRDDTDDDYDPFQDREDVPF